MSLLTKSRGRGVTEMAKWQRSRTTEAATVTVEVGRARQLPVPSNDPRHDQDLVRKTPGVLGGDARIRDTRIAVWMIVRARQLGMSDEEIRGRYRPPLSDADLDAAWRYYAANKDEIDRAIMENEAD